MEIGNNRHITAARITRRANWLLGRDLLSKFEQPWDCTGSAESPHYRPCVRSVLEISDNYKCSGILSVRSEVW